MIKKLETIAIAACLVLIGYGTGAGMIGAAAAVMIAAGMIALGILKDEL